MDPAGPLPAHLESQPHLSQPLCIRCAKQWGGKSASVAEKLPQVLKSTCETTNDRKSCNLCNARRRPCETIDPSFRRSANLMIYLWKQYVFIAEVDKGKWELETAKALFHTYAVKFVTVYNEWAREEQAVKEVLGDEGYEGRNWQLLEDRRENSARFMRGEKGRGPMPRANAVVDDEIESDLYHSMSLQHLQEFWFGSREELARHGW